MISDAATNGLPGHNGNGHATHSGNSNLAAFEYPRDFLQNQYVYLVISPRAGGLSVGVNLNPVVTTCTFRCLYCEVDRSQAGRTSHFDLAVMATELCQTLRLAQEGRLRQMPRYHGLPPDLLKVRHVTLSGDGEPTLAEKFGEAIESVIHLRALGKIPGFKLVLLTNSTALHRPEVQRGLSALLREDEIWAKLDAGTQSYLEKLNGGNVSIEEITKNILTLARQRPVVIQSLFPAIDGAEPPPSEIEQYVLRLKKLKEDGAQIPLVQIYSATRPMAQTGCSHLPLKTLSRIAQRVRKTAGLKAEVF